MHPLGTAGQSIVEQLRSHNDSVSICIAQILPFGSDTPVDNGTGLAELNAFVDSWNARLGELVLERTTTDSPIVLVDMNSAFGDEDLDDVVHLNKAGA